MKPLSLVEQKERCTFVLCFQSLIDTRRVYAFPCDALGHVDMDALDERSRNNYLYARAVIGWEVSRPMVQTGTHPEPQCLQRENA
jgi:hypothetical protein